MLEVQYQAQIIEAAEKGGWSVSHDPDSRRQKDGEPDLECTWERGGPPPGPHRHLRIELKGERTRERPGQRRYRARLTMAGVPCYLLRMPEDLDIIEQLLGLHLASAADTTPDSRAYLLARGKVRLKGQLPFGIFLGAAGIVSFIFCPSVISWYQQLIGL